MSALLEDAVRRVRELPPDEQDDLALALYAHLAHHRVSWQLSDDQVEEVRHVKARVDAGLEPMATDEEVAAFRRSRGL